MEFECEMSLLAKTAETRQHFFSVDWFARVYRINESVATFFLFFLRISQMKRISGVKMRRLRGKPATIAHGCGPCFLFGNNAVTFSGQTQQKPTPPSRAPHDEGLPSQQREHPRAHSLPKTSSRGRSTPAARINLLVTIVSFPMALAAALGEAVVLASTSAEQSPSE